MEDPPPLVRFRTFLEYPLSPLLSERMYFLNGPKSLSIFYKTQLRKIISILGLTPSPLPRHPPQKNKQNTA